MSATMSIMKMRYILAKSRKIGEEIMCPSCGSILIKKTKDHVFCSNGRTKGAGNCKDAYWNKVDNKKRNRKHPKSHYRKYNVHKPRPMYIGSDYLDVYRDFHPFEGLNDDEYKNF
jgi:hypothetical protein